MKRTVCKPLIYDWRAPVSSLFYDYDKGPASYEAPAGRLDGEILSKWQFKIQNGELVYAFESDTKIDDDILKMLEEFRMVDYASDSGESYS